ncbi:MULTISPECIES: CDP-glycerol glycerophosphotransferase family protein [Bacillus]|uniref:CDP-ribitol ribitolphosphotransferase n=1 Tax=Bacillus capparidis TaxID=1840411 RepID=A0ABS4CVB8_9BACI|nr:MULTISPECIES: CDP-glycerol glycerophosphotransferase family protein [Bacillus]MBP1081443.1 CDP-ribitol ribitolphosphotransferase [Bacillus capparidis]MED1096114.1 CDP-glycerol glycerophosphotransferase family protein [Bacillus capparidis]
MNLLITKLVKIIFRGTYGFLSALFPVKRNKVVIASYRDEELSDNFKALHARLNENPAIEIKLLLKKMNTGLAGKAAYVFHLFSSLYHIATSRVLLLDDYYFPLYVIKKRKETISIQLWHACGAFKKFGYSIKDKPFGPSSAYLKVVPVHSNYDYSLVSSAEAIPHFAEAFNMDEKRVLPLGVPRTDYFFKKDHLHKLVEEFQQSFPGLKSKTKLLYAPTFRGSGHYQESKRIPLDLQAFKQSLDDPEKYVLFVHLHPYMKDYVNLEDDPFICDMTDHYSLYDIMVLSDALLTDYSSVIFEYSLLKKPIYFYCPDLEEYTEERDFYYPFETFVPGPISKNTAELARDISQSGNVDKYQIEAFSQKFITHQDGQSSNRAAEWIESFLEASRRKRG